MHAVRQDSFLMNPGLMLILVLGCLALAWFVWLGYLDHRKLRQQFQGTNRAAASSPPIVQDTPEPASRRTNS
jgi:hypothetical protein